MEGQTVIARIWAYIRAIIVASGFLLVFNLMLGTLLLANAESRPTSSIAEFGRFISESGIGAWNYLFIVLFCVAATHMLYFLYSRFIARRKLTAFQTDGALKDMITGLVIGFGIFSVIYLLGLAFGVITIVGTGKLSALIIPLGLGIQAGYSEELVFRNILYRRVWKIHGHIAALVMTSVPFGVIHLVNPGATILGAINIGITAGVLFGICYAITRRIWLPIFLHLSWNFTQGGIYGLPVSGISTNGLLLSQLEGPLLLTGGAFGIEASILTTIVLTPVSIIAIYLLFNPDKLPESDMVRLDDQSILN